MHTSGQGTYLSKPNQMLTLHINWIRFFQIFEAVHYVRRSLSTVNNAQVVSSRVRGTFKGELVVHRKGIVHTRGNCLQCTLDDLLDGMTHLVCWGLGDR